MGANVQKEVKPPLENIPKKDQRTSQQGNIRRLFRFDISSQDSKGKGL
jgi:hypothetical protein